MMELIAAALPGRAAAREELLEAESAGRVQAEEELARVRAVLGVVDRERRRQAAELDAVRDVLAESREENRHQAAGRAKAETERDALAARLDAVVAVWGEDVHAVAATAAQPGIDPLLPCVALYHRLLVIGYALAHMAATTTYEIERRECEALHAEVRARIKAALVDHPTNDGLLPLLERMTRLDPADDITTTREDEQ
ncbi:hypothetical protein [Marinitenerispora sediminis]|uniref:hypothetical protein n=1 Tax=Marinitenerispora sediminis TaxID=1931232 RepID=UPI0011C029B1|nr:hypothetical protein [Marinitenerispora sediminis]